MSSNPKNSFDDSGVEAEQEQPQEQPQHREPTDAELALLEAIMPIHEDFTPAQIDAARKALVITDAADTDAIEVLKFNRVHKKGDLHIRRPEQFCAAVQGSGTFRLLNEYSTHDFANCKQCREAGVKSPDTVAKIRAYEREQESERQFVLANPCQWDWADLTPETMEEFKNVVNPERKKNGFLPVGCSLPAEIGKRPSLVAAINYVVRTKEPVDWLELGDLAKEAAEYADLWHKWNKKAKAASAGLEEVE